MGATNFTVTVGLLVAFTIFIFFVRSQKPLEDNWPFLYWFLVLFFTLVRAEDTFNFNFVLVGLFCGLLLRFEFLNPLLVKLIRGIELVVFGYIVFRGVEIVI
ncbi:MAG TPA: hypothetical protein VMZ52_07385 [Bryobacteraceae bacterium]|nr:hypothetical protein [Bryobacteraceae bacterium]